VPPTYLDDILAAHRARAGADRRDLAALLDAAVASPLPRDFAAALGREAGVGAAVIAEVKRRSPAKGPLDLDLDPAAVARAYEAGGAACLSVLTDAAFFSGSPADLAAARAACTVPVLRKDFTVGEADVCDARLMGADAVLLIVAALSDGELTALCTLARELELAALVEVHDEDELARALDAGAEMVGVNQRDLVTFAVDPGRAVRLAGSIPPECVGVAESGIRHVDDVRRLADAGYQGVLVGESLVRAPDRQGAVRALTGQRIGARRASPETGAPDAAAGTGRSRA